MTQFSDPLSLPEIDLTREFMMLTVEDEKDKWTTDDLRAYYGLNLVNGEWQAPDNRVTVKVDWLKADLQHGVGALAAKWRLHKISVQCAEEPSVIASNNRRMVDVNCWGWNAWRRYLREHFIQI